MEMLKLKGLEIEKRKNFPLRLNDSERAALQKKADKYTGGDLSKWIRYAALNYEPSKKELVEK